MFIHNINPTIISLGPLEIRWYGVVYVLGFFLAIWWLHVLVKKGKVRLLEEQIWDLIFYVMVGLIVGARLFQLFWNPSAYIPNLFNLLKIWEGGMSFHGGLVGAIIGAYWFCKKNKINFYEIADAISVPAIFALALGRIANFINGELWGKEWNGKFCVNFNNTGGGDVCRHPSQLYAAGKRFIIFGWLIGLQFWKQFTPGFIFWNLVFFEGLGRFVVDFYRVNERALGLSLGQWFSLIMILAALWFFWKSYKSDWKQIFSKK